MSAASEAKSAL